jgi:predicted kinase
VPTEPTLVVIRGNSGSGKTTIAREVRRRYGRGCALLEQDHLRRIVLREHDNDAIGPVAPAFIAATAGTALGLGYHVILEGILHSSRYAAALAGLVGGHPGPSYVYYLDVPFEETLRRHATRAVDFSAEQMRGWYVAHDVLGVAGERVVDETATLDQTVSMILHTSGLAISAALTPCPVRCTDCAADQPAVIPSTRTPGRQPG